MAIRWEHPSINLRETLTSGQAFHWKKLTRGTGIVSGNLAWHIIETESHWEIDGDSPLKLADYLDLHRDYDEINRELMEDPILAPYVSRSQGLHLLNQEPWDTIVAFIISANNNMKRIQNSIEALSKNYGCYLHAFEGEDFYALPRPGILAEKSPEELRQTCGVGYRDKYLVETAKLISQSRVDLEDLENLPADEIMKEILTLPGVGPKVGHCILLFGYGCEQSFPVDTWMEKAMNELYGPFKNRKEITEFGMRHFGNQAGYVQQLLFHGARKGGKGIDL